MYDRILFPTDGSDVAGKVLDHAIDVAADHDATLHVLNVADTTRDSVSVVRGRVVDALEREGERIVEAAAERVRERGVETTTEVLQGGPAETIVDYADSYDVDLVVMPTHGRQGLQRLLLGSVTERVVRTSDVPVLTVRPDATLGDRYPYENVLVPTDGSECSRLALLAAADVAEQAGAAIHLLNVVDTTGLGVDVRSKETAARMEEAAAEVLSGATGVVEGRVPEVATTTRHGEVSGEITAYVEENDVDLVVVGTHGRTGVDRYLLGSVAEKVVRSSAVPVMTIRESVGDG